jgi:hypothetical protein
MRLRSSRREHHTTRPVRGAERHWVEEVLLASADEDRAVERWEHDMTTGPRQRGNESDKERAERDATTSNSLPPPPTSTCSTAPLATARTASPSAPRSRTPHTMSSTSSELCPMQSLLKITVCTPVATLLKDWNS